MLKFIKQKNIYSPTDAPITVKDSLPAGVYDLILTPNGEIKFEFKFDKFVEPERYYGDKTHDVASYVQEDYNNTAGAAAAILNGSSGMGKTMTAKYIANRYIQTEGKPVIRIYDRAPTSLYKAVLEITGGCCILIDEYEKINYVSSDSNEDPNNDPLLSVLDDESLPHSLFILTTNSITNISNYLLNRPGRIGTLVRYDNLDQTEIDEYIEAIRNDRVCEKITAFMRTDAVHLSFDELVKVVNIANRCETEAAFVKQLRFSNTRSNPISVGVQLCTEETEALKECKLSWSFDGGHLKAFITLNDETHAVTTDTTQLTLNGEDVKARIIINAAFDEISSDLFTTDTKPDFYIRSPAPVEVRQRDTSTPTPQYYRNTRALNAGRGMIPTY